MKHLSADVIAGFFREWAATKPRQLANMPTAKQCADIAAIFCSPYPDVDAKIIRLQKLAAIQQARYDGVVDAVKVLRAAIENLRRTQKKLSDSEASVNWQALFPDEVTKIDSACANFMKWNPHEARGRPAKSRMENEFALLIAESCKSALADAAWRSNTSLDSDFGPVAYVVAKCLSILENSNLSPSGAASRIRNAKLGKY